MRHEEIIGEQIEARADVKLREYYSVEEIRRNPERTNLLTVDDEVTSRFFGFKNRYDYYYNAACYHRIPHIRVPTIFMNALDDPIIGHKIGADAFL